MYIPEQGFFCWVTLDHHDSFGGIAIHIDPSDIVHIEGGDPGLQFRGKNHGMIRDDLYQWDNWDNNIGNIWSYGISQWDNNNNNSNNNI